MKQFDLEQQILGCWQVTGELGILLENVIENDSMTKDDISNVVLGLQELYELKFDKCFRTFEDFLKDYYKVVEQLEAASLERALTEASKPVAPKRAKKNA